MQTIWFGQKQREQRLYPKMENKALNPMRPIFWPHQAVKKGKANWRYYNENHAKIHQPQKPSFMSD